MGMISCSTGIGSVLSVGYSLHSHKGSSGEAIIGVIVMGVIFVRVSCNSIECASKLLHSRDVAEYPALCDPKSTFHSGPSGFISGTASDLASDSSIINDTGYSTTSWAMASHGYRDTFISTAFVGLGS